jgi:hypothetical protein
VDGVKAFGLLLRQLHHLEGAHFEAGFLDAPDDFTDQVFPHAVGFEDG